MWRKILLGVAVLAVLGFSFFWYMFHHADTDIYPPLFAANCGSCHGDDLEGTDRGMALINSQLPGGDSVAAMIQSIRHGHRDKLESVLSDNQIKGLAMYIGERRMGQRFVDFSVFRDIEVPVKPISTEQHTFKIEEVYSGLDPLTYSIEPMPDGSILVTERTEGLAHIATDGTKTQISGAVTDTRFNYGVRGIPFGIGWLFDVALHPDYEENGWIYLTYTELCSDTCEAGSTIFPASMLRMDRARIKDNEWVDVESILSFPYEYYTDMPDTAVGGRIAFDNQGHVHVSLGMKEPLAMESQNLDYPHGKTHRVRDDGQIPPDNPFVVSTGNKPSSVRDTIWTYGHRSPHGLEWNPITQSAWNTEMGPRGGDEVNELKPGGNYGWPYHSLGLEYAGVSVARNEMFDIEFDQSDVELTLVDFTPSPAVSSFAFYDGDQFTGWKDNLLLGTLKGMDLYRLEFDDTKLIHKEIVVKNLGRMRDIAIGFDGFVYLLLETSEESMIVRLVPTAG